MNAKTPDRSKTKAKRVPVTKGKVAGFLSVGPDAQYFVKALEAAGDSYTASACMDVRSRFIQGNGLLNEQLANLVVNRQGQTLDEVLADLAAQIGAGDMIPAIVGYNGLGKIVSLRAVPFENILLAEPDDLNNINRAGIFPYLGSDMFRSKALKQYQELNFFNPNPDVVLSQIVAAGGIDEYPGQLLYLPFTKSGDGYYHIARWFSSSTINDMETERELSIFDYKTVSNSFSGSGFAVTVEEEIRSTLAEGDDFEDADSIESQIQANMGNRDAGNAMVVRFKNREQADAFRWVDTSGSQLANRYQSTTDRVALRICTAYNVPAELANVRRAGGSLFASPVEEEMANRRMQHTVNPYQRKLEQTLFKIFSHWHMPLPSLDFSIENQNYFDTTQTTQAG